MTISKVDTKQNKKKKMTQREKEILADKIEYYGTRMILFVFIVLMLLNIFSR